MAVAVGDILMLQSDVAGKAKYHFCFCYDAASDKYSLMFLNSENVYRDHFVVDCSRLPSIPPSRTGKSIFSCPTVIRKTTSQITLLAPKVICKLPKDVATDFLAFAQKISSMTAVDKQRLIATLTDLATQHTRTTRAR